ncbi:MAG: hypothetical protein AB7E09_03315 [Candidatus Izemoplasmatales bacterium]
MKFLGKHIEHAWIDMMNNHDNIIDGLIDLTARKEFVSSLQNVIELIFKQYLIDRNDYELAVWKPSATKTFLQRMFKRDIETRSNKQIDFESVTDLNTYFITKPSRAKNVFTIQFSRLIDKIFQIIRERNINFDRRGLRILNRLRNEETHFYIDDSYLLFSKFIELRKLIKDVYDYIEVDAFLGFFGNPGSRDKNSLKYFDHNNITGSSYFDLVINSKTNQEILNQLNDISDPDSIGLMVDYHGNDNIFSISYQLFNMDWGEDGFDIPVKVTQYELYRRLILLNDCNKIYITDDRSEYEDEHGNPYPVHSVIYKK